MSLTEPAAGAVVVVALATDAALAVTLEPALVVKPWIA